MKTTRPLIPNRLLPALCLLAVAATSPGAEFGDFIYTVISSNTVTIDGYLDDTAPGGSVVVPETIEGKPVTIIASWAFKQANIITNITLPENLVEIRNKAFYDNDGITRIDIPDNVVEIGESAFFSCNALASATIGDSVATIGQSAFSECHNLAEATLGNNVSSIEGYAFSGCSALTQITIPNGVVSLGSLAFRSCTSLLEIAIPNSVSTIGGGAFQSCNALESAAIGSGTTSIASSAFIGCGSLEAITVDAANPVYSSVDGVLFNKDQTTLISCPNGKTGSCSIPATVVDIESDALLYNKLAAITVDAANLVYSSAAGVLFNKDQTTLITFPGGRTGSYTIPGTVATIGESAFSGSLSEITVPGSVATIGDRAFSSCYSLTGVYFEGNAPVAGSYIFLYSNNATVYYRAGTTGWDITYGGRPTALWMPSDSIFLGEPGIVAGQFGFTIDGASGQVVVVEASAALTNSAAWQPLQTNTLGNDPLPFSDPQWSGYPTRCYRVHTQ